MSPGAGSSPNFPQELLDLFVEAVGELPVYDSSRPHTLLACNLVSRSFNHLSRRYLFKHIEVKEAPEPETWSELTTLQQLLSWTQFSAPESSLRPLAVYVKEFTFHFWTYLSSSEEEDAEEDAEDDAERGVEDVLACVFNHLHAPGYGLRKLSLYAEGFDWELSEKRLQAAACNLFRSPHLRCLRIRSINNLPRSFLRGTRIKHLQMYECQGDEDPEPNQWEMTDHESALQSDQENSLLLQYPQLEILDVDINTPLIYLENSLGSSTYQTSRSNLRVFKTFVYDWFDYSQSLQMLSKSYNSIEILEYFFGGDPDGLAPPPEACFNLTAIRNLRHLCLYHNQQQLELTLEESTIFLSNFTPSSSLRNLELVIVLERQDPEEFLDSFLLPGQADRWIFFDEALTQTCSKSSIRDVSLTVHFDLRPATYKIAQGSSAVCEEARQSILQSLPSLNNLIAAPPTSDLKLKITIAFSLPVEFWDSRALEGAIYYD